jgi:predicted aminopeptidase
MSLTRFLLLLLCTGLAGCGQAGYFAQAAKGQWDIISERENIQQLLDDHQLNSDLRQQLELVRDIREFASRELHLPDNMSYRYYSETGRPYVVWNVVATARYQLTPKTWCFPFTGCIAYKGYFAEADATELNKTLMNQDYDTFLYGVSAYSTLGWFSDPVLDTFVNYSEKSLAELIFHELAHQVVYVKNDSGFNEAFATTVGERGLQAWMKHRYPNQDISTLIENNQRNAKITDLILGFRDQLAIAYEQGPESDLAQIKSEIFSEMRQAYAEIQQHGQGTPYYDWWFNLELNNAHLSSVSTYHRLVPGFEKVLDQAGSFDRFYSLVEDQANLPRAEREAWLLGIANE